MENISLEYPLWYLILCIGLGLLVSGLLYFREKKFQEISKGFRIFLSVLRFSVVSILAILLLSPLLKSFLEEIKDSQIVVLEDASLSISAGTDPDVLSNFKNQFSELISDLSSEYQLDHYQFGDKIIAVEDSLEQTDAVSNISEALTFVHDTYNDQNLGAIVLVSDGLYNEGMNPIYQNLQFKAPLYTIGLGDTSARRDLQIKNVFFNKIAYLGDIFSIQIDIQAFNCNNSRSQLSVFEEVNDQLQKIHSESFNITSQDFFSTVELSIEANNAGVRRFRIQLDPLAEEMTRGNNIQDIFVEILDAKQKIGIIANAPHPDLSALKRILENNKNYELDVHYADEINIDVENFDFVVFHNLPSRSFPIDDLISRMNVKNTARLFIVGAQTDLNQFRQVQNTINISGDNIQSNEVQSVVNKQFNLFNLEEKTSLNLEHFLPLLAPFGEYEVGPKTAILLFQKIGNVSTPYPLICFSEELGVKTAVIAAEGIWKWQLYDFMQHDNNDIVSDLINQSVTYTTVKEDKRKFRVVSQKNLYKENERISFSAQLYNNSYQLVNEPDVFVTIRNSKGEEFDFIFSRANAVYQLDAGLFPNGTYRYDAEVNYLGNRLTQNGKFTVQEIQLEMFNLTADHQVLYKISEKHAGKFIEADRLDSLQSWLQGSNQLKPMVFSSTQTKSVIHIKWLFIVLFLLLSAEWFFRRYFGTY